MRAMSAALAAVMGAVLLFGGCAEFDKAVQNNQQSPPPPRPQPSPPAPAPPPAPPPPSTGADDRNREFEAVDGRRAEEERQRNEAAERDRKAAADSAAKPEGKGGAQNDEAAELKKLDAAREAALKGKPVSVKLIDLVNKPAKYAGQVVRVDARVSEIIGRLGFVDEVSAAAACKLVLAPPARMKPGLGVVISFAEWQAGLEKFENLKGAQVEAIIYVSKAPAAEMTDESPAVGRLYEINAK